MKKQLCLFERLTCGVRVLASASVLSTYVNSYQFISEFICQNYHFVLCHSHLKIRYSARHVRDRQRAQRSQSADLRHRLKNKQTNKQVYVVYGGKNCGPEVGLE